MTAPSTLGQLLAEVAHRSPAAQASFLSPTRPAAASRERAAHATTLLALNAVAAAPDADQLLISSSADSEDSQPGTDLPLRLSTLLSRPTPNTASDGERSVWRMEYQLLAALHVQAEEQLAVAEQLRRLEATLAQLQKQTRAQAPSRPPSPSAMPPQRIRAAPNMPDWWLESASLVTLIAGLTWLLRRRSERRSCLPIETATVAPAIDSSDDSGWELQPASALLGPDLAGDNAGLAKPAPVLPTSASVEVTAVLELAEIMLSFGRLRGAEQALEEFIEAQPLAALTPWLKLLETYQHNGQRQAFAALAVKLKRHFNVAPADWDAAAALGGPVVSLNDERTASIDEVLPRLPTIGPLTRISKTIARTWGAPECRAYLNNLLRDNRNGLRHGFSVAAVRELLFLIDLLEIRLAEAH